MHVISHNHPILEKFYNVLSSLCVLSKTNCYSLAHTIFWAISPHNILGDSMDLMLQPVVVDAI